jgi:hypothetical protein
MSDKEEEKTKSPFDIETEDDTIALSQDELADILSEAEIVQEKPDDSVKIDNEEDILSQNVEGIEEEILATEESSDEEAISGAGLDEEDDFDITGEIDQLSAEDVEDIELEEGDVENYARELESEIGEDLDIPDMSDMGTEEEIEEKEVEEELKDIGTKEVSLESNLDEEMDIDSYLESDKSDIDLESIELEGDEATSDLEGTAEAEESEADLEVAFKEAGIEGLDEELAATEETVSGDELLEGLEEALPSESVDEIDEALETSSAAEGELTDVHILGEEEIAISGEPAGSEETAVLEEMAVAEEPSVSGETAITIETDISEELAMSEKPAGSEEVDITEEMTLSEEPGGIEEPEVSIETDIADETAASEEGDISLEELESEITLTEEEESILSEDLDIDVEEGPEKEEVITVTGDELDQLGEEEVGLPEPSALEGSLKTAEIGGTEGEGDQTATDSTLMNDITVILKYMDNMLGDLPEEKIKEFSQSKYFSLYKEVFQKLNIS